MTTGMLTKAWTAVHRKHHSKVETEEDRHSPQVKGLKEVVTRGAELYRTSARDQETLEKYGKGTPDDWLRISQSEEANELGGTNPNERRRVRRCDLLNGFP